MSDADKIKGAKTVSSLPEGYEVPEIWKQPQPMAQWVCMRGLADKMAITR